jgi:16S rRNA (guanine966-N2)-methyltransferase
MRIVSGRFKGRKLAPPPEDSSIRPTSDRAREALFDILTHAPWSPGLEQARVLDLYAGTGALGFEALSRGAVHATFVEHSRVALALLRQNAAHLGVTDVTTILGVDVASMRNAPAQPFDIAFIDPPYEKGLGPVGLARLQQPGWLNPEGVAIVETSIAEEWVVPEAWVKLDERRYGKARLTMLRPSQLSEQVSPQ